MFTALFQGLGFSYLPPTFLACRVSFSQGRDASSVPQALFKDSLSQAGEMPSPSVPFEMQDLF